MSSIRVGGVSLLAAMSFSVNAAIAQTPTSRIVAAANAFLSTLDQAQRGRVLFGFDDDKQRAHGRTFRTRWFGGPD